MEEDEVVEHSEDAGEKVVNRTEQLLTEISGTLNKVVDGLGTVAEHLSKLELQKAAEAVPETARETVDQGIDAAGTAGDLAAKSVDVPLAVSEDVIHDTGESVKEA